MSTKSRVLLATCLAVGVSATAQESPQPPRPARLFNPSNADQLEQPGRDRWQMPARVVEALELEQGEVIADIGTGSGYFVPYLSRSVGGDGRVYAVDIQQEMLAFVQRKVVDLNLTNVVTVLSQETDTRLSAGSVDLALMVDVYHELGSPRTLLANIRNVLKANGKFAIVDFHAHKEATVVGPPLSHRVPEKRLIDQVEQGGFRLVERHTFLPYQYFLVFARADTAPGADGARSTSGGPPP